MTCLCTLRTNACVRALTKPASRGIQERRSMACLCTLRTNACVRALTKPETKQKSAEEVQDNGAETWLTGLVSLVSAMACVGLVQV